MSDTRPSSRDTRRRRIGIIGAVTATAALGAGVFVAVQLVSRDDDRTAAPQISVPVVVPPSSAPAVALPAASAQVPGTGAGGGIGLAEAPISLTYTFDGGPSVPVTDADGLFPMRIVTRVGGALSFLSVPQPLPTSPVPGVAAVAPRASGFAMAFPPRCDLAPTLCPRAILEGVRNDALNPGTRPLQYGASVLMSPADTADGANVVQKGYSVGGVSQFKLQVDHEQGHPSCVIASRARIYRAEPKINVADSAWHTIVCTRSGSRLGITVDGVAMESVHVPPELSIANAEPLRIGGKGVSAGNDQFAGQIDNVFLTIS